MALTFMFEVLKALKTFGTNFIKWLRILYINPKFRVKNNGFISKTSRMTRGIRQEAYISSTVYFNIEILAIWKNVQKIYMV